MKRLIMGALLAGVVAMLPNPTPADAREDKMAQCLAEAITSCDRDLEGNDVYMAAARGYCYMIRTGMCLVLDSEPRR
jgi:hypothetical protein